MISIKFDPNALDGQDADWFEKWSVRASNATAQAIKTQGAKESTQVWKDLKIWLLDNVYFGKCGYCEWPLVRSYGAADHYRPKSRVSEIDLDGRLVPVVNTSGYPHRGYYWLAYRWENLVPACDKCNTGTGKLDQFPVARQRVFDVAELHDTTSIDELDAIEEPLLLNPYRDDPADHLTFGTEGVIHHKTRRGQLTIETCRLDASVLNESRKKIQEYVDSAVTDAYYKAGKGYQTLDDALRTVQDKYLRGNREFAAAARVAFDRQIQLLTTRLRASDGL